MPAKYPMVSRTDCLVRFAVGVPTSTSRSPVHCDRAIWNAASSVLKSVAPVFRASSFAASAASKGKWRTNRSAGPEAVNGPSNELQSRGVPVR